MATWLLDGMIRIRMDSDPVVELNLKTDIDKKNYIKDRTTTICTMVADKIRVYLANRRMTKKEFSERTKISKWRLKRILDGNYGGITLEDFAIIQCVFYGEHDKATRKVIIEKFKSQKQLEW